MKREEVVRGLERFIDDYKRYINHADWQRLYNALALLKERGPKAKPQFDDDALDRNTYIKVGDLIDCVTELSMPEDAAFHLAGAIEWACGKRAVALPKEQETMSAYNDAVDTIKFQSKVIGFACETLAGYETEEPCNTLFYIKEERHKCDERCCNDKTPDEWCWRRYFALMATEGSPTPEQMEETPREEVRRET